MEQTDNLLNRLNQQYHSLSKGQKRLAKFITDHYDKAVFMTAAKHHCSICRTAWV